jgi:Fur family iron response transcriptional regulator
MNSKRHQIKKAQRVGGKYDSSAALLQDAGLRPTKQRLALAGWLFDGRDKHVTAEQVYAAAARMRAPVSLATVYNSLNHFTAAGLLRQVAMDGGQVYFDTNISDHYHIFDENSGCLTDIPITALPIGQLPKLPRGKHLSRVDVVVRVRD